MVQLLEPQSVALVLSLVMSVCLLPSMATNTANNPTNTTNTTSVPPTTTPAVTKVTPVTPDTPILSSKPVDRTLEIGTELILTCTTRSVGSARYKFFRYAQVVYSGSSNTHNISVTEVDSGNYSCVVEITSMESNVSNILVVIVKPRDLCVGSINPCLHQSRCFNDRSKNTYFCQCKPGYVGKNCEDFDHCSSDPCNHPTTCSPLLAENSYKCVCLPDYRTCTDGDVTGRIHTGDDKKSKPSEKQGNTASERLPDTSYILAVATFVSALMLYQ